MTRRSPAGAIRWSTKPRSTALPGRELTRAVLREINKIRELYGLEPVRALLRGVPKSCDLCPVGRTMNLGSPKLQFLVDRDTLDVFPTNHRVGNSHDTPQPIRAFIEMFDAGAFPGLTLPAGP